MHGCLCHICPIAVFLYFTEWQMLDKHPGLCSKLVLQQLVLRCIKQQETSASKTVSNQLYYTKARYTVQQLQEGGKMKNSGKRHCWFVRLFVCMLFGLLSLLSNGHGRDQYEYVYSISQLVYAMQRSKWSCYRLICEDIIVIPLTDQLHFNTLVILRRQLSLAALCGITKLSRVDITARLEALQSKTRMETQE